MTSRLERILLGYVERLQDGRLFIEPDLYEHEARFLEIAGWIRCERFASGDDVVYRIRLTAKGQAVSLRLGPL